MPATAPEKVIAEVDEPLQTISSATAFTVGVGLTVIVNVLAVPPHVTPPLV